MHDMEPEKELTEEELRQPVCAECDTPIDLDECGQIIEDAVSEPDGGLHLCVLCVCYVCFYEHLAA